MNKKERVLKTLDHEEPDIVPITEMSIDTPHMETILGRKFEGAASLQTQVSADRRADVGKVEMIVECYVKLGFELVTCDLSAPDGWEAKKNPDGTVVDEWGRVLAYDSKCKSWIPCRGIFKTPEEFEEFPSPDPEAQGRTFAIKYMKKLVGDELALAAFIRDPFAHAWEILEPVNFVRWLYEKPQFIARVLERITEFNTKIIKRLAEAGADLIISGGDYAESRGMMAPIKFFRSVVFEGLKRQVEEAHKAGLKFIKHTDGNINSVLADLSRIVDGLHSLDPSAGMDIGVVKSMYGDRLVLIGNVAVDSLCRRSRDEVVEETKECLRRAAPGGGYILSSSNSWYTDAKLENCLAMVETGRKYGAYPINICRSSYR